MTSKVILTAAQCVNKRRKKITLTIDGVPFTVREVHTGPKADPLAGSAAGGIALLILEKPTAKQKLRLFLSRPVTTSDKLTVLGGGLDGSPVVMSTTDSAGKERFAIVGVTSKDGRNYVSTQSNGVIDFISRFVRRVAKNAA